MKSKIIFSHNHGKKKNPTKGIVFYTDHQINLRLSHRVQRILREISKAKNIPITCVSIKKMMFGDRNINFPQLKRGYLSMFKQILAGLEASKEDIIFLCEHDVLYYPSHFDFIPPKKDIYYYNQNWWKLRLSDGFALHWDANGVSGLCAYREHLLKFYRKRVTEVEKTGYMRSMGFEPEGRSTTLTKNWKSEYPNVDIRHGNNLSKDKWGLNDFFDKSTAINMIATTEIPGWGNAKDLVKGLI